MIFPFFIFLIIIISKINYLFVKNNLSIFVRNGKIKQQKKKPVFFQIVNLIV